MYRKNGEKSHSLMKKTSKMLKNNEMSKKFDLNVQINCVNYSMIGAHEAGYTIYILKNNNIKAYCYKRLLYAISFIN